MANEFDTSTNKSIPKNVTTTSTQDIIDYKHLSEQRFKLIIEHVPVLISYVDAGHRYRFVNKQYEAWFGHSTEDIQGKHLREVLGAKAYKALKPHIDSVLAGNTISFETNVPYKGAGNRYVSANYIPHIEDNKVVGFFVMVMDLSDRKKIEENLRYRTALLEAQSEATPDGILIVDARGKMLSFNKRFIQMWKIPKHISGANDDSAALKYAMTQLVDPKGFIDRVNYLYAHQDESSHEEVYFKDGRVFDRYGLPVEGDDGQYYGWAWHFRDITTQKRAEEKIILREEQLRVALKASRMGVWEWDSQNRKLTWSNEVKRLYGLKISESITYEKYISLLHPDDQPRMQKTIANAQKTGSKYTIEHRVVWPDGSIHWLLGKGQAFLENGKIVRMAGISLDIDDRKKAEELYQSQNEYLIALNETALEIARGLGGQLSILKIILSRATKLTQTPNGYIYLMDDDKSQLSVRVATGVFKPYIGHVIKKGEGLAGKVWKTGKHLTVGNYDIWTGRQATFPKGIVSAAVGLPLYSGRRIIGVIALGYDTPIKKFPAEKITALKRLADLASIALDNSRLYLESQEREERFRTLADTAPVFIWLADSDKNVSYFNKGWLDYAGRTLEQEMNSGWEETIYPADLLECRRIYETSFDARVPFTQEYRLRRHDGQFRWMLDTGIPRFSSAGEFLGYIGSTVDIHDLKNTTQRTLELEAITASLTEQRAELVTLNNAKDEFISLASHQLRTPATGVKQFIGMLLENYFGELTEDQRTMLDYAYESNERQLEVINDLLKVAQVDAGKVVLAKEKHDISDMLEDIMQEQRAQFAKRKQRVVLDRPTEAIFAPVDVRRMRMVVENLIDNASKYTPEGKRITVSINQTKSGEFVTIKVKDEGVGIAEEDISKLFQKFSRLDNPLSIQVGGTGIGLYWAKKIVDLHGGNITIKSISGEGSTFIVKIPA
ncbi:PAS domain S-box protein [Candidatus Saccharibacteria bacterium]|nr:PAS domain S-box protein [Candidatus Saccharibacteria bacterium]